MNEVLLRRLIGALVLLLVAFVTASLLPGTGRGPVSGAPVVHGTEQVVRYDLRTGSPVDLKLEPSLQEVPTGKDPKVVEPVLPKTPGSTPAPVPEPAPATVEAPPAKPTPPPPVPAEGWSVQVGSFANPANARSARDSLKRSGLPAGVQEIRVGRALWYRVRVGPYAGEKAAQRALDKVQGLGYRGARVVRESPQ